MSQLLMLHPDVLRFAGELPATVRALDVGEAPKLAELLRTAFEDSSWTGNRVVSELINAADIYAVYGVLEGDQLIATASARKGSGPFEGQGYVHMVATHPGWRGRGLGRTITEAVLADFAKRDLIEAVLETDDWRTPALRAYLGMGFVPVIRDHSHYRRWSAILSAPRGTRVVPGSAVGEGVA